MVPYFPKTAAAPGYPCPDLTALTIEERIPGRCFLDAFLACTVSILKLEHHKKAIGGKSERKFAL